MNFVFVGGGNMGRALASALIGQGVSLPSEILVVEPDDAARARVAQQGCQVLAEADERVAEAPAVVLAVKPQIAPQVFERLARLLGKEQVVISIMAGVTLAAIKKGLQHPCAVRVMPNTPAQVGLGMNVYFPDPSVADAQIGLVEKFLRSSGEVLRVGSEDAIDAATAISGSGPAYVFFVAEHWMKAAQQMGFSQTEAEQLVQQTLFGATALWRAANVPPSTLREQVTSKGGTTAAALEFFQTKQVGEALEGGIARAYQRAKELAAG